MRILSQVLLATDGGAALHCAAARQIPALLHVAPLDGPLAALHAGPASVGSTGCGLQHARCSLRAACGSASSCLGACSAKQYDLWLHLYAACSEHPCVAV